MASAVKQPINAEKRSILTPEFRASYAHLFKAQAMKGGKPKFSVTMLFPKTTDLAVVKLALKHAKIDAYGPDKDSWPEGLETPVNDGDAPKYAKNEGYAGHWVIKASTNEDQPPTLVDEKVQPIIDPRQLYSGCYARASIFAYAWEFGSKQGISFILDSVQKTRDGKPFSSRKTPDQIFTPINAGAGESEEEGDADF